MISVDAYPFLVFSDLTSHLEDTGMCFLVALYNLTVSRLDLEVATKSFSAMFARGSASL